MDRSQPAATNPNAGSITRGPNGKWRAVRAAATAEERSQQQDRIALSAHLMGHIDRRMRFDQR